ncbi:hypothetical protein, partial [Brevibacterium sp. UBA7493]|uniref:hypothetical protein n=1 Tax=Brevibacterium sp. UBA7493 TaxID=1946121 RepID=UPI00257DA0F6
MSVIAFHLQTFLPAGVTHVTISPPGLIDRVGISGRHLFQDGTCSRCGRSPRAAYEAWVQGG